MRALTMRHSAQQETFAQRLRAAREHARLTHDELAARTATSVKRLQALEAGGTTPPTEFVIAAAKVLEVPQVWLAAGSIAGKSFVPAWYAGQGGAA